MSSNGQRSADMPADVITALSRGQKIEAIKRLREARGIGLKEAKDAVDSYVAADPALRARLGAIQEESKRSLFTYLGVIIILAVLAYAYIRLRG